jgi:hypothetical protein
VHRDIITKVTNKMQLYRSIYYSKSALHVSGDVFARHQKHLTVFTVSGSIHPSCCRLVSWISWNCSFLLPSTIAEGSTDGRVHTSHLQLTSHTAFSEVWPVPDAVITFICAPGDGWSYHPKHVEQFTEI